MIEFLALGGVRLTGGDAERLAGLLAQPKRVALLAYLALARPRGFQSRDTLLALFWPELDGRHARWALNQAVRHLRQALGGDVVLRRGSDLGIDPTRLTCDAAELEAACGEGRWEDALRLYGGDLLAGVAPGGAAELEHWLDGERERLLGLAARAASARSEELLDGGDMPGAARFAREAVRLAPDDEARARRLIELLSAVGDRAGALRAYEDYAARLRSAGDVAPAPETQALMEALRTGGPVPGPVARQPVPTAAISEDGPAPPPTSASGSGLHRVPRRRVLFVIVGVGAVLLVLGFALTTRLLNVSSLPQVVVKPFVNLTGESALDPVGHAVGESVVDGLTELGTLGALPVGEVEENASFSVSGSYRRRGDSIEFVTEIVDQSHHRALPAPEPVRAPLYDPLIRVETVRDRAAGALGYYTGVFRASQNPERRPPSYPAYLAFNDALRYVYRFEPDSSEGAFRRALKLDPTYTEAYMLLLGFTFSAQRGPASRRGGQPGRPAAMDSLAREMRRAISPLTEADRFVLQALEARARGDLAAGLSAYERLADLVPPAAFGVMVQAMWLNRPRVALDRLRHLSYATRVYQREFAPWWGNLAATYHEQGDYRGELQTVSRGLERFPQNASLHEGGLRAAIALGRLDEVERAVADLQPPAALRLALEARAHGYPDEATRLLLWALRSSEELPPAQQRQGRFARAVTLSVLARQGEAMSILEQLSQEDTLRLDFKGMLGVVSASQGDRAAAARYEQALAAVPDSQLQGLPALWRARIAAALGDGTAAVDLLRRAFAQGTRFDPAFMPGGAIGSFWHSDPAFGRLRDYAPYEALIRPR